MLCLLSWLWWWWGCMMMDDDDDDDADVWWWWCMMMQKPHGCIWFPSDSMMMVMYDAWCIVGIIIGIIAGTVIGIITCIISILIIDDDDDVNDPHNFHPQRSLNDFRAWVGSWSAPTPATVPSAGLWFVVGERFKFRRKLFSLCSQCLSFAHSMLTIVFAHFQLSDPSSNK